MRVVKQVSPLTYRVRDLGTGKTDTVHVKRLLPFPLVEEAHHPLLPRPVEEDPAAEAVQALPQSARRFLVERLRDVKVGSDGRRRYLVKWAGFATRHSTWEPAEHLPDHAQERAELDAKLEATIAARAERAQARKVKAPQPRQTVRKTRAGEESRQPVALRRSSRRRQPRVL